MTMLAKLLVSAGEITDDDDVDPLSLDTTGSTTTSAFCCRCSCSLKCVYATIPASFTSAQLNVTKQFWSTTSKPQWRCAWTEQFCLFKENTRSVDSCRSVW